MRYNGINPSSIPLTSMASEPTAKTGKIPRERRLPSFLQHGLNAILRRVWYLHPPIIMTVALPPGGAILALRTAAKPSTERLHLRNVFAAGRRYYLQANNSGFLMTTNAKQTWRYAHRTSAITIMRGFLRREHDITFVEMHSRMKISYLLDVLLIPTFIASLIISMPWQNWMVVGLIVSLYALSWFGHRYNAILEAYEMLFFVEKTFEDYQPQIAPMLEAQDAEIIYDRRHDFASAWQTFYEDVIHPDIPKE